MHEAPTRAELHIDKLESLLKKADAAYNKTQAENKQLTEKINSLETEIETLEAENVELLDKVETVETEKKKAEPNKSDRENYKIGIAIDKELFNFLNGEDTTEATFSELKEHAPLTYNVLFEGYEKKGENGLITSNFEVEENKNEQETFTIKKINHDTNTED